MTRRIALALLRRAEAALRHRQLRSALNSLLSARVAGGRRAALMRRGRAHVCVAQLLRVQRRLDWLSGESWLRRGGAPVRAAQALLAMYGRQAARLKVALEDASAVALLPATFGAFERLRLRALCAAAVRSLRCRAAFGYWQSFAQAKSWMGTFVRESMRGRAVERRTSERQRWLDEVTAAEARWLGAEAKLMARQRFASVTAAEARWLDKVAAGAAKEEPALLSTLKVTTRPTASPAHLPPTNLPSISSPQLEQQEPMPAPSSLIAPPQDDLERLSVEAAPHAEPPNEYDEQMASAHLVASLVADAERALAAVLMSPAPRLRF